VSGLGKMLWVIVLIVFPYLGVFIYLVSQGRGMAERQNQRVEQARDELRQVVGFSVADEIEKLEHLKNSGAISNEEYAHLRAKAVQ
jgi:septation ring formation regulator EzrA